MILITHIYVSHTIQGLCSNYFCQPISKKWVNYQEDSKVSIIITIKSVWKLPISACPKFIQKTLKLFTAVSLGYLFPANIPELHGHQHWRDFKPCCLFCYAVRTPLWGFLVGWVRTSGWLPGPAPRPPCWTRYTLGQSLEAKTWDSLVVPSPSHNDTSRKNTHLSFLIKIPNKVSRNEPIKPEANQTRLWGADYLIHRRFLFFIQILKTVSYWLTTYFCQCFMIKISIFFYWYF